MKVILASLTPSQRSILNSWIIYQSLHLNSSIASHIHPKRTYRPKLSLCVLSVSGFTVLPVASLFSVKGASLSSQLQRNCLGSKLLSNTGWFSTTLLCRLRFSVLQLVTTAGNLLLYLASQTSLRTKKKHNISNLPSLCL